VRIAQALLAIAFAVDLDVAVAAAILDAALEVAALALDRRQLGLGDRSQPARMGVSRAGKGQCQQKRQICLRVSQGCASITKMKGTGQRIIATLA
jgi:hypothetical protein